MGFGDAFLQARKNKEDKERLDKLAKLQGQVLELTIKGEQEKGEAAERTFARMQPGGFEQPGRIEELVPGEPLQTTGGREIPRFQQRGASLSELLTDPQALADVVQSGQVSFSEALKFQQPTAAAQTAFAKDAAAAGILPGTEEFTEAFKAKHGQDPQSAILAQLVADQRGEAFAKARSEREKRELDASQGIKRSSIAVRNHFSMVTEAVEIMRDLKSTVLQSGIPGGETLRDVTTIVGALQEFFGKDSPQATLIVQKRDRLKKLLAESMRTSLEGMRGIMSVARINTMLDAMASLDNLDVANTQLFADHMRNLLDEADIIGFPIEGREAIEAFISNPLAGLEQAPGGPTFGEAAVGQARAAFDTTVETAQRGFDVAQPFVREQVTRAGEVAQQGLDIAQPFVQQATEQARSAASAALDFASSTAEKAEREATSAYDELRVMAAKARPKAIKALTSAAAAANDAAEQARQFADELRTESAILWSETADEARVLAADAEVAAQQWLEIAEEGSDAAILRAKNLADNAANKARRAAEDARIKARVAIAVSRQTAQEILGMTKAELRELSNYVAELSAEMRVAAESRWDELNAGR